MLGKYFKMALMTNAEMKRDGWKVRSINKVKCLVLVVNDTSVAYCKSNVLISPYRKSGIWELGELLDIVEAKGRPFKAHTLSGVITSLEYLE
jgi:hypothetical protein